MKSLTFLNENPVEYLTNVAWDGKSKVCPF